MANPTRYVPGYSYTDYQESNPDDPLPGPQVDNDFANLKITTDETVDALSDVRRSDGALKNDIVTIDSLSDSVKALLGIGDINFIEPLAADRTYYIDPVDGDDANDGLDPDVSPFETIQQAIDSAMALNCNKHKVVIQLVRPDAPYAGFSLSGRLHNAFASDDRPFQLLGDPDAPEDYLILGTSGNAVDLWNAGLYMSGVTVKTTTGGYGFLARHHTSLDLGNVRIDDVAAEMIACQTKSVITLLGTLDVVGDANSFCHVTLGGHLILTNRTVNFAKPGGNSFAAYVWGLNASKVNADGTTFTGTILAGYTTVHDASLLNLYSANRSGMTTSLFGTGPLNIEDGSYITDTLQQTLNYYVNPLGSDYNDGLESTAARAFKTIQGAIDFLYSLSRDHNKFSAGLAAKIMLADGTYAETVKLRTMSAFETVRIIGNGSTPANVIIAGLTDAISGTKPVATEYSIESLSITAAAGSGIRAENGTQISFTNVRFGACSVAHLRANTNGTIRCAGSYAITGGGAYHIYQALGGTVDYGTANITVTLTQNVTFSTATVKMKNNAKASIDSGNITWSLGAFSVTGKRYELTGNSTLDTDGGSSSYIPGNSSGTADASSVYL